MGWQGAGDVSVVYARISSVTS